LYRGVNLFPIPKDLLLDKFKYGTITRDELKALKKILYEEFELLEKEYPVRAMTVLGVLILINMALEETKK